MLRFVPARETIRKTRAMRLRVEVALRGIDAACDALMRFRSPEFVLGLFGAEVGGGGALYGPLTIHNASPDFRNLRIGARTHVGRNVLLDLADKLTIEDDATISMGCTILTHQDIGERPLAGLYPPERKPTTIGTGAYLGANVTVLAGCGVGAFSVVGAGAVVREAIPPHVVAVGVPARVVRKISASGCSH